MPCRREPFITIAVLHEGFHAYLDQSGTALTVWTRGTMRALLLVILLATERTHALVGPQEPADSKPAIQLSIGDELARSLTVQSW